MERGELTVLALVGLSAVLLAPNAGWLVVLAVPLYVASRLLHEMAHLAGAAVMGVPRERLNLVRGKAHVPRVMTTRQDVVMLASGPLVSLVTAVVAIATLSPAGTIVAYANVVIVFTTLGSSCAAPTDGARLREHLAAWREKRRMRPLLGALAHLDGPGRFDDAVRIATPYVRRDPLNLTLAKFVGTRLQAAHRPQDAAAVMRRYAAQHAVRPAARTKAWIEWADVVLTYPDLMPDEVEEAMRVVADRNTGAGFLAQYLNALAAFRRDEPEDALTRADDAIASWESGELATKHALGCVHGVRALALFAMDRTDEAAAAIGTGLEYDAECDIPDVLDEARAALAA